MNPFLTFYDAVLFNPIVNALFFLYNTVAFQDFGIAIVILTIIIRLLLYPLFQSSLRAQKNMAVIQPDIKRIQEEYKSNKEEQAKKLLELYKERGVNPFSGCLPILIQLPILIALYNVFLRVFDPLTLSALYPFISHPTAVHTVAFGFLDLSTSSILIGIIAGLSQYVQALTMPQPVPQKNSSSSGPDMANILSFQMKYFFPILIMIFSFSVPSALPLYWTVLNLFAIVQQKLIK